MSTYFLNAHSDPNGRAIGNHVACTLTKHFDASRQSISRHCMTPSEFGLFAFYPLSSKEANWKEDIKKQLEERFQNLDFLLDQIQSEKKK